MMTAYLRQTIRPLKSLAPITARYFSTPKDSQRFGDFTHQALGSDADTTPFEEETMYKRDSTNMETLTDVGISQ